MCIGRLLRLLCAVLASVGTWTGDAASVGAKPVEHSRGCTLGASAFQSGRLLKTDDSTALDKVSTRGCNVLDYGAAGDNRTEDTAAVVAALAACAPGGTVLLPKGHTFLLRPIELPSHIELRIEGDIQAWAGIDTWPNSTVRFCFVSPYQAKVPVFQPKKESLLWTVNATDVTISGGGTVFGGGAQWWHKYDQSSYWHHCRPSLVEFGIGYAQSQPTPQFPGGQGANHNIFVRDITLDSSPYWTFVARGASNLVIERVSITTPSCAGHDADFTKAPNTDGFNIGGSDGVVIRDAYVRNRDDCVPLFPPMRNVSVTNITCECGNGLVPVIWPMGAAAGQGGNISNVTFDGAHFVKSRMAVAIKSLDAFVGTASNIIFRNFVLHDVDMAVMMNVNGQSALSPVNSRSTISSYQSIIVENISGTATSPGKILCSSSVSCNDIVMKDVVLSITGAKRDYQCANVFGTAMDCQPTPCLAQQE